jgi:WD40 repeat protein
MKYLIALVAVAWPSVAGAQPLDDPLPPGAVARLGTARFKHVPGWYVHAAAFSPDGRRIASASRGSAEVIFWDAANGKEQARCTLAAPGLVQTLAFSPDGTVLAVSNYDAIVLLDARTARELRTLGRHQSEVRALVFTPDGKTLVSVGREGHVAWWDVESGNLQRTWQPLAPEAEAKARSMEFEYVMAAALAPGGTAVAMQTVWRRKLGEYENEVVVFDLALARRNWSAGGGEFMRLVFSPDGRRLAVSRKERLLELRDSASGQNLAAYVFPVNCPEFDNFHHITFSPDGNTVAVTGSGRQVGLWNLDDTTSMRKLTVHFVEGPWVVLAAAAFSPDSKTLLVGVDSGLELLDVATGRDKLPWPGHREAVGYVAFANGGRSVVTADSDGHMNGPWEVLTWQVSGWKLTRQSHAGSVAKPGEVAVAPDHSVGLDGQFRFINLSTSEVVGKLDRMLDLPRGFRTWFSPSGRLFVFPGNEDFSLFAVPSGKLLCKLPVHACAAATISADDRFFALCTWDASALHVYDIATAKLLKELKMPTPPLTLVASPNHRSVLALSADNRLLAAWSYVDNAIHVWDLDSCKKVQRLHGGAGQDRNVAVSMAWSPDGRTLAVGGLGDRCQVQLWELLSGRVRRELHGHTGAVTALAFSPDGRLLASGSEDTTVLVWNVWGK